MGTYLRFTKRSNIFPIKKKLKHKKKETNF